MASQKDLIENLKKVCICRGITGGTINQAIRDGAHSFEALRRILGTGTGNCKAKRCRQKIEQRVKAYKDEMNAKADKPANAL